jgi:hypothetical protein
MDLAKLLEAMSIFWLAVASFRLLFVFINWISPRFEDSPNECILYGHDIKGVEFFPEGFEHNEHGFIIHECERDGCPWHTVKQPIYVQETDGTETVKYV